MRYINTIVATALVLSTSSVDADVGDQLYHFAPSDGSSNDQFGIAVGFSGSIVIVGTNSADDVTNNAGAAYLYNATTGENITAEFQINNYTSNIQSKPSVCALTPDTFVVAWHSNFQDGSSYGVYASVFNASTGKNITSEYRLNNITSSNQQYPSISSLTSDTFAAAWHSGDGSGLGIYAAVFNATTGKNLTSEVRVNDYMSNNQQYPFLSAITPDSYAVAWESSGQDGSDYGVFATVLNASSNEILISEFQVNNYTTSWQYAPSISPLTDEAFVIAWSCAGQNNAYAKIFNSTTGENITAEQRINTYAPSGQSLR